MSSWKFCWLTPSTIIGLLSICFICNPSVAQHRFGPCILAAREDYRLDTARIMTDFRYDSNICDVKRFTDLANCNPIDIRCVPKVLAENRKCKQEARKARASALNQAYKTLRSFERRVVVYYEDFDFDGAGSAKNSISDCEPPTDGNYTTKRGTDCNDADPNIQRPIRYYVDADGDKFGNKDRPKDTCTSEEMPGLVRNSTDCDDTDKEITGPKNWYPDSDEDGYGDKFAEPKKSCTQPEKYIDNKLDCDDSDERIPDLDVPNSDEPCEEDLNCDGITMRCPPSELRITSSCVNDVLQIDYQIINSKMIERIEIQTSWDASNWKVIKQLSTFNQGSTLGQIIVANRDKQAKAPFVRLVGYTSRGRPTYSTFLVSECTAAGPLNIAPNPNSGRMRVFLPADKTESIELSVADSKGVILESKIVQLKLGLNVIEFDLVKRSSGLYAVIVKRQGGVQVGKIIKQ